MAFGTERPIFKTINKAHGRAPAYAYLTGADATIFGAFYVGSNITGTIYDGMLNHKELAHYAALNNAGIDTPPEYLHTIFPNPVADVFAVSTMALGLGALIFGLATEFRAFQTAGTFLIDHRPFQKKK